MVADEVEWDIFFLWFYWIQKVLKYPGGSVAPPAQAPQNLMFGSTFRIAAVTAS